MSGCTEIVARKKLKLKMILFQGDAVFWHNLLRSGEGDFRTRHAGCPVLKGWKWGKVLYLLNRGEHLNSQLCFPYILGY